MTRLGKALRVRRSELNQSQEQAAVYIGTTRQTYAAWESGKDYPRTFDWVPKIAAWLEDDHHDVGLMILDAQESIGNIDGRDPGLLSEQMSGVAA